MTFLYVNGVPLAVDSDGRLGMFTKTVSGLQEYRTRMSDRVLVSALKPPVAMSRDAPGMSWQGDDRLNGVELFPLADEALLAAENVALVQGIVTMPGIARLIGRDFATVLVDDYSPAIRREITLLGARRVTEKARVALGHTRETRRIDDLARRADGMQCLGASSFEHYRTVNSNSLQFSDHRLSALDIERASSTASKGDESIHLAFSGRLIRMKGAHLLVDFARVLESRGVAARLSVFGAGELEAELRNADLPNLLFGGFLDFERDWKSYVRENIDVMFMPHLQGDPSCTYLEAMGSGAPVLGFRNLSLSAFLADGGGGWEVPRGDLKAAADVVSRLVKAPEELRAQRRKGLAYLAQQPSEQVFDARVKHLLETRALKV